MQKQLLLYLVAISATLSGVCAAQQQPTQTLSEIRTARSAPIDIYCDADAAGGSLEKATLASELINQQVQRYAVHLQFWNTHGGADPKLVAELKEKEKAYQDASNDPQKAESLLTAECRNGAPVALAAVTPTAAAASVTTPDSDSTSVLQRWAAVHPGMTIKDAMKQATTSNIAVPLAIQQIADIDADMLLSDALRIIAAPSADTNVVRQAVNKLAHDSPTATIKDGETLLGAMGPSSEVTAATTKLKMFDEKTSLAAALKTTGFLSSRHSPLYGLLGGTYGRAIVGYEQAGASAAPFTQNFFANLFISDGLDWRRPPSFKGDEGADFQNTDASCTSEGLDAPGVVATKKTNCGDARVNRLLGPRPRIFGDIRVTSVPQQNVSTAGGATLGNFVASFPTTFKNLNVNQVARGVELISGVEVRLHASQASRVNQGRDTRSRITYSTFIEAGFTTPFSPQDPNSLQTFLVPPVGTNSDFFTRYPNGAGKKYIAFTPADRDRFFRQYYVGLRLRNHYFDAQDQATVASPSVFDIAWGGNEAMTGGRIHGAVLKLDGFTHLPGSYGKFVFLFGTAYIKPARSKISPPLLLNATGSSDQVDVTSPQTYLSTLPQYDRDYYRIGIGVDLTRVFSATTSTKPQ